MGNLFIFLDQFKHLPQANWFDTLWSMNLSIVFTIFDGLSAHLQKSKITQTCPSWFLICCSRLLNWKGLGFRTQYLCRIKYNAECFLKILPMIVSVSWRSFMIKWFMIQKVYSKNFSNAYSITHYSNTTFKLDGMV